METVEGTTRPEAEVAEEYRQKAGHKVRVTSASFALTQW